ncbi:MAG: chromosomal replication initiator protein DnaA [Chitinophagia bacterium]|nr:chromosomal replication initiator protein DnaA [Chitinophagia bacterium]
MNHTGNDQNISLQEFWDKCLAIIKDNVNWQTYKTWFDPIKAVSLNDDLITLQVPSQFFYEWIEEHYVELLAKTIRRVLGRPGKLEYRIMMESNTAKKPAAIHLPGNTYTKPSKENSFIDMPLKLEDPYNIKTAYAIPGIKRTHINPQLVSNYQFDNYIEGDCNRLARGAGQNVAKKPGTTAYNPMVIYGGVGCGKTHLLHAIGNEVLKLHPNRVVLYVSAEKFITQFMEHGKNNAINDFIHYYQLIDVLLLDDIQMFAKAEKTQDAFFAIFNHLHQNGKQLVMTSDVAPRELQGLQERLLSRFRWGLNAEIAAPGYETRQEILNYKLRRDGVTISDEVVKYIAYNIQSNIRDLEGALITILAQSTINRKDVDLDMAKKVMKNFVKTASREVTIANIQKLVCDFYNVPYDKLLTKTRKREIVLARQITMYLAKKYTKNSLKSIGEHFGGFDHTTVIHSCQTVENLMDSDNIYKDNVNELLQKVQMASF